MTPPYDVKDLSLASRGLSRIMWAEQEMPVLRLIRERFEKERPLAGLRVSACLHVTSETANLMRRCNGGGQALCVQSSRAGRRGAALVPVEMPVFAIKGDNQPTTATSRRRTTVPTSPWMMAPTWFTLQVARTSVTSSRHQRPPPASSACAMQQQGQLAYPIIAVNDADTSIFDNATAPASPPSTA